MLRIGLTGGIGSGKSTAAEFFSRLGIPVIDADVIARELARPGTETLHEIVAEFGADILLSDGELDRRKLASRVFRNPDEKRRLERIIHPRVRARIHELQAEQRDAPYIVIVIPLLLESGMQDMVDRILVIDADEATRVRRVRERDNRTEEQIIEVMRSQADAGTRHAAADDLVMNDASTSVLRQQIEDLHRRYLVAARHDSSSSATR